LPRRSGQALAHFHRRGQLRFTGQCAELADASARERLLTTLRQTPWVVYAKPPFGGPERVLKYLSRYTHRVAIANHRLQFVGDGVVRFTCKDYADHHATKTMTLPAREFLRRFLLHVVPRGFVRIRHYGLVANRHRDQKLARCRDLLGVPSLGAVEEPPEPATDHPTPATEDTQPPRTPCPICGGAMRLVERLAPRPADTS
jgi:hypothetical protein